MDTTNSKNAEDITRKIISTAKRIDERFLSIVHPDWANTSFYTRDAQGIATLIRFLISAQKFLPMIPIRALSSFYEAIVTLAENMEVRFTPHSVKVFPDVDANFADENLNTSAEVFLEVTSPWISYISLLSSGGATANAVENRLQRLNDHIESSRSEYSAAKAKLDQLLEKAQEAAAGTAASKYAFAFENEANQLKWPSRLWLSATLICAALTIAVAFMTWYCRFPYLDSGEIIQLITSKLIALSVLISATIWCGRMYKTLMNQIVINRFRALGLTTFQAFYAAGADTLTKNAVLLETTKSIFAQPPTGLVETDASNSSNVTNIVELAKAITAKE